MKWIKFKEETPAINEDIIIRYKAHYVYSAGFLLGSFGEYSNGERYFRQDSCSGNVPEEAFLYWSKIEYDKKKDDNDRK